MTTGGWIFMIIVWGIITTLMVYCYTKVISNNGNDENSVEKYYDQ